MSKVRGRREQEKGRDGPKVKEEQENLQVAPLVIVYPESYQSASNTRGERPGAPPKNPAM